MDSDGLRMLHMFMLQHMLRMSMFQTADIFAAEAGITYSPSEINLPYGFLTDWWNMFWNHYSPLVSDYISNNDGDLAESSAQAEARARIQDQAHADAFARARAIHVQAMAHVQTVAYAEAQAQGRAEAEAEAEAEAQARAYAQAQAVFQAQARAEVEELGPFVNQFQGLTQAQAQSWAFSNGGRTAQEQYFYTMWPLVQQYWFHGINTNSVGEPALGLGTRWTGEQVSPFQQGLPFPGINTNSVGEPALTVGTRSAGEQVTLVQQGPLPFPGILSYPRPNIHLATQSSQVLSHMVNRAENGTWEGTTSNLASQLTIAVTSTSEPPSSEPLDLDAINGQFNARMMIICGNKLWTKMYMLSNNTSSLVINQVLPDLGTRDIMMQHKNKVPCRIEIENTIDKSAYSILVKSLLQRRDFFRYPLR